jgi:N-acetylmuramoyl-L-alanine amidase
MCCVIFCTGVLFAAASQASDRWDSQGAADAFQLARQKRDAIAQSANPTLDQYIDCARTYHRVHFRDPHYGRTGDAIYEEALVYQEAADRFLKPEYYRLAANRLRVLVNDYSANQNCKDALKRLASICSKHLGDDSTAEEAYQSLKTRFRYSSEAIRRLRAENAPAGAQSETAGKSLQSDSGKPEVGSSQPAAALSTVQSIRFWTAGDYTRVIIDMDSETKYVRQRLYNPDRIYFDISNSKLDRSLNRDFTVGDDILKQVRVAQNRSDVVRIVFDITAIGGLSISEMHDPFRIVIDLRREGAPAPPPPAPESKATTNLPSQSPQKPQPPPMAITEMKAPAASTGAPTKKEEPVAQSQSKETTPPVLSENKPARAVSVTELPPPAPADGKQVKSAGSVKSAPEQSPQTAPATQSRVPAAKKSEVEIAVADVKAPPPARPEPIPLPKQAAPTSQGDRTLTRMLGLKVGRIVLDPGHGGNDHGTTGPGGMLEKDLVLSIAHSLREMIREKIGAEVFLTREDDTFISLEERTAFANRHRADLFISIHANSSRIRSISGVETYYLDFAKTDAEREIAARENATADGNVRDLQDLIKKIAQADKSVESRELASIVQKKLYSGTRKVLPSTKDRGVRSAPFIVLIGADMPSVLAEVAFISNPKVERLLRKESTKQSLVKALFTGIDGYMKALGSNVVYNQISRQTK